MIMFNPEIVSRILDNVCINLDKRMINTSKDMNIFRVIEMTKNSYFFAFLQL
jgi:hypothetical protein